MYIKNFISGAGSAGSCYIVSNNSTTSYEDLGGTESLKWAQMYLYRDKSKTEHLVRDAEKNGFKAVVLTADLCRVRARIRYARGAGMSTFRTIYPSPVMESIGLNQV